MSFVTLILVFVIVWWLCLFPLLNVGMRAQNETDEGVVQGTVPSAPENPHLVRKMLAAALIAAILTGIYYWVATSGIVTIPKLK